MPAEFNIRVNHMAVLEQKLEAGEYVSGPELAEAIRDWRNEPLPGTVSDYLCRFLNGEVSKPRGRKPLPRYVRSYLRDLKWMLYRYYLVRLQERQERYGRLFDWPKFQVPSKAGPRPMPSHEIAARLTARQLGYGEHSWRSLQTEISSTD